MKQYVDGDVGECQHPILKKHNYGIEWLRFVINRDLGCASHSDFQSTGGLAERIRDRMV